MYTIIHKREVYSRTASGKSWKKYPDSVTTEEVERTFYNNFVDSVRFFNNFGFGASCRAFRSYTIAGYIPTRIVTISPGRSEKHVDEFRFEYFG